MSQITLVFGVAPALAPVIGGALLNLFGWRAIFWVMLAFTTGVVRLGVRSAFPRRCRARSASRLHPRTLWKNYRAVLLRAGFPAARRDPDAELRRVLHLHRQRAVVPRDGSA